jgi:hypothetical protein
MYSRNHDPIIKNISKVNLSWQSISYFYKISRWFNVFGNHKNQHEIYANVMHLKTTCNWKLVNKNRSFFASVLKIFTHLQLNIAIKLDSLNFNFLTWLPCWNNHEAFSSYFILYFLELSYGPNDYYNMIIVHHHHHHHGLEQMMI